MVLGYDRSFWGTPVKPKVKVKPVKVKLRFLAIMGESSDDTSGKREKRGCIGNVRIHNKRFRRITDYGEHGETGKK